MRHAEFRKELRKLVAYARDRNVSFELVTKDQIPKALPDAGAFYSGRERKIFLTPDWSSYELALYVAAHEIGHSIDMDRTSDEETEAFYLVTKVLEKCVRNATAFPEDLRPFLVKKERRACSIGERVIRKLRLPLSERTMLQIKRMCVRTYKTICSPT